MSVDPDNDPGETTANTAYVENPISIAARNTAYTEESNKRLLAETDLRAKVAAREEATAAVRAAFTSPQRFYNQLVARRTALKADADKAVADAATPTDEQNMAAENEAKALMEAEMARDNLVGLFEDEDDPTVDLIGELLKAEADGDDGGALVKAISSNYDRAKAANDSAIGRNSEMITGLQDQMEIVRAGVAASVALAGMPAINGRGISIRVGSFDGESAFAVGFQIQSEMASFKVGVTSAGGETGASAGVGFQF